MILIRTADQLARFLASCDPPLRSILEGHRDRLAEYDDYTLEELATFFVFEPGDQPEALKNASDIDILAQPSGWEYLIQHQCGWYEAVFVLSDFGEGVIVLIPDRPGTDGRLLHLCEQHVEHT